VLGGLILVVESGRWIFLLPAAEVLFSGFFFFSVVFFSKFYTGFKLPISASV